MNILKKYFLFNKKNENNKILNYELVDNYREIAKLVKEARIQQNLTIQELSRISKIPEQTINSIENNTKNIRPKFPFIRSILIKLEECLILKKNTLVKLATREGENFKKEKPNFLISKFDLLNTWQGSLLYFFILILTIFILKRYFILKVYKKDKKYLLIKNTKFNFLKNLNIFPMEEVAKPKNFNENLNFKISNMNMNIKIQYKKNHEDFPSSNWIDQKKLDNYLLPTFTKKIVQYLESN